MGRQTLQASAILAIACAALLGVAGPAAGQAAGSEAAVAEARDAARRAYALSSDLMSPFCPGRTLQDCPSPDAGAVREQIRSWIDAGLTDGEIRERLESAYGGKVVGLPRTAFGWIAPIVLLVIGLGLLALALRRSVRSGVAAEASLDPEVEAALLEELDDRA